MLSSSPSCSFFYNDVVKVGGENVTFFRSLCENVVDVVEKKSKFKLNGYERSNDDDK